MHQTESIHFEILTELVQFTVLNQSYFPAFCNPLTVEMHTQKMINNFVWGSHVEIYAISLYLGIPVFVALDRGTGEFYWAKYELSERTDEKLLFPGTPLQP